METTSKPVRGSGVRTPLIADTASECRFCALMSPGRVEYCASAVRTSASSNGVLAMSSSARRAQTFVAKSEENRSITGAGTFLTGPDEHGRGSGAQAAPPEVATRAGRT